MLCSRTTSREGKTTCNYTREQAEELEIQSSNLADALAEAAGSRVDRAEGASEGEGSPRELAATLRRLHDHPSDRAVAATVERQLKRARGLRVSKVLGLALGILAAIGGFVDIGDLVFNTAAGATFGYQLMWVIPIGVVGIIVYSEMCGRVAAVSGKAVFDAIRERVGFKAALGALVSSEIVNLMTLACEIGGVAIALQLLSGLPYRWLILLAVVALAVIIWVTSFEWIERLFGYGGLCMLVFAVAAVKLGPDWAEVGKGFIPHISQNNTTLYLVLRGRPARRGDDAVRGLLLLVGRGRGALGAEGHRHEPGERDRRLRARRHALDRADDRRRDGVPRARHLAGAPRHDRARRRTTRSARSACCSRSSASSSRSAAPRSTPCSRARTTSPSSAAGSGDATAIQRARRASR